MASWRRTYLLDSGHPSKRILHCQLSLPGSCVIRVCLNLRPRILDVKIQNFNEGPRVPQFHEALNSNRLVAEVD
jgi:hypothetical protein